MVDTKITYNFGRISVTYELSLASSVRKRNARLICKNTYIDIFEIFKSSTTTAFVLREIQLRHQILSGANRDRKYFLARNQRDWRQTRLNCTGVKTHWFVCCCCFCIVKTQPQLKLTQLISKQLYLTWVEVSCLR